MTSFWWCHILDESLLWLSYANVKLWCKCQEKLWRKMTMDRNGLFVIRRNRETASSKVRSEIKIVIFGHFWWKIVGLGYFEVNFGANFRSERSWVKVDGPWGLESNNVRPWKWKVKSETRRCQHQTGRKLNGPNVKNGPWSLNRPLSSDPKL